MAEVSTTNSEQSKQCTEYGWNLSHETASYDYYNYGFFVI